MRPLRVISKVAVATFLFFLVTSFKPAKNRSSANVQRDQYYYWYLDSGKVYDDWTSVSQEITRLEDEYDVYVDEDPVNGTLIASGYFEEGYPHYTYASILLYSH